MDTSQALRDLMGDDSPIFERKELGLKLLDLGSLHEAAYIARIEASDTSRYETLRSRVLAGREKIERAEAAGTADYKKLKHAKQTLAELEDELVKQARSEAKAYLLGMMETVIRDITDRIPEALTEDDDATITLFLPHVATVSLRVAPEDIPF